METSFALFRQHETQFGLHSYPLEFHQNFGETLHDIVPFVKNINSKGNLKIIFLQLLNGAKEECYNTSVTIRYLP